MGWRRNHSAVQPLLRMTVITRSKLGAGQRRRRRDWRPGRTAERTAALTVPKPTGTTTLTRDAARRRREAGAPQDQAIYSCGCGFVFEAQVSTSVGCPLAKDPAKDLGCQDRNLGGSTAGVVRRSRLIVRTSAHHLARPARGDMRSLHI